MSSDEVALDAVVDSILLRGARPSPSPASAHATSPLPLTVSDARAPSATREALMKAERSSVETSIRRQPQVSPGTSKAQAPTAYHDDVYEEDDLNALVERILSGPGPAVKTVASSSQSPPSHRLSNHHHHSRSPQSPALASPSISPASSSLRCQPPPSHTQHPPQQQQQCHASVSGSGRAASRRTGGTTRADTSLSRASGGGLRNASLAAAAASPSPMDAVVRRLELWQERRQARRVQSVYEALEKEQEECTFEPSINRLSGGDGSRSMSSHRHHADEECWERPPPLRCLPSGSPSESQQHPIGMSCRNTSAVSCETGVDYVPSLLPPTQSIYGVEGFVERLRRAQEERDAVKAAEEAKRLHYYDPNSFKRGITIPEPFEFSSTRTRRAASSTAPVPGVPSPLSRLRVAAAGVIPLAEGGSGERYGAPGPTTLTRSVLSPSSGHDPLFEKHYPGASPRAAAAAAAVAHYGYGYEEEEAERLTAENTFVSLAPQIRETLLFDPEMEQQLRRTTEFIRRSTA